MLLEIAVYTMLALVVGFISFCIYLMYAITKQNQPDNEDYNYFDE